MHPSQARAMFRIERGITHLTDKLLTEFDVDEEEVLEVVRNLPDLNHKLQHGEIAPLYEAAKRKFAGVVNLPDNPKEYFPGHPDFRPPVTTKDTFNEHMAQAMEPYVLAIARKVAKDRGVALPNEAAIKQAVAHTDWARAAYEAKHMPKKPSPGRLRQFFSKYVFRPIGKVADLPLEHVFGLVGAGSVIWIMWATFNDRLSEIGMPLIHTVMRVLDWDANRKYKRYKKKFRPWA